MHTDKFGRTWRFAPNYNPDQMIQVPWEVMMNYMIADRMLTRGHDNDTQWIRKDFEKTQPDCYVLKLGEYLYTGARMSDEPSDYRSSCILNKGVLDAMLFYVSSHTTIGNFEAITDLLGRVEVPEQCW